jgi:hypothetical protein
VRPTRFTRWVRKLLTRSDEGPAPPARLGAMCLAFANEHPLASRGDWVRFASAHAAEAWAAGYARGYEQSERPWLDAPTPEQMATALDPNWIWRPGLALDGNAQYIPQDVDPLPDLGLLVEDLIERTLLR